MKVIKTEIDGKLVIGIVFENKKEQIAVREFAGKASTSAIDVFMKNNELAEIVNEHLLYPMCEMIKP